VAALERVLASQPAQHRSQPTTYTDLPAQRAASTKSHVQSSKPYLHCSGDKFFHHNMLHQAPLLQASIGKGLNCNSADITSLHHIYILLTLQVYRKVLVDNYTLNTFIHTKYIIT
jgi:hypothetical protein